MVLQFVGDGEKVAAGVLLTVLVSVDVVAGVAVAGWRQLMIAGRQHLFHRLAKGGGGNGGVPVVTGGGLR